MRKVALALALFLVSTPAMAGGFSFYGPGWGFNFSIPRYYGPRYYGYAPRYYGYPCSWPDCPGNPYVEDYLYNRDRWEYNQWRRYRRGW